MNPLLEHLLAHYIDRDTHRLLFEKYSIHSTPFILGHWKERLVVNTDHVHLTRTSLLRVKSTSLQHLHSILHMHNMTTEFSHLHIDDDIVTYLIEEEYDFSL